jgi:hypothetical protein
VLIITADDHCFNMEPPDMLGGGLSLDETLYIINHLFVPPRLPLDDDQDASHDDALLQFIIASLKDFRRKIAGSASIVDAETVQRIETAISVLADSRCEENSVDETTLLQALKKMNELAGE